MLEAEYQRNYDWKKILNTLNVLNMHILLIMHIYMAKEELLGKFIHYSRSIKKR